MSKKRRPRPGTSTTVSERIRSEPRLLPEQFWTTLRADAWTIPLAVFLASRAAIFLMASLFIGLVPVDPAKQPGFIAAFSRWDTGWYSSIVNSGYQWLGPGKQSNVAFFPLYPLLAKIVSIPLLGNVSLALLVVSNLSFFAFLCFLYRLTRRDFGDDTARRALLYVAIFCLSFFFSAGYSESLALALVTGSFFYAREGNWRLAIALGFLATMTRLTCVCIVAPLAWEWYKQKGLDPRAAVLLLVPAGLLVFMGYLRYLTGDLFAFNSVQTAWNHHLTWPWGTLKIGWDLITSLPASRYITTIAWVDVASMLLFLALSVLAIRFMPPAYFLYSFPVYFIATSATLDPTAGLPTASIGRYLMSIFPAFMLLAHFGSNRYLHYAWLFLNAVLLGPLLIYFFAGIWVE